MLCIAVPQSIINKQVTEANNCFAVWQGCVPYSEALELQLQICELKRHGFSEDVLLLLEHPPTITLGRSAKQNNLLANEDFLKSRGIGLWNVDRGGDVTFHGPGQLVGYPIMTLRLRERDVHGYMRNIEESLIRLLAGYGIEGFREAGFTGVWTQKGKIAAMGVHISRWITRHGFALNVNTDLSYFDLIVPCGIEGREVASMKKYLMRDSDMEEIAGSYILEFGAVFNRNMIRISENDLREKLRQFSEKFEGTDQCNPIIHSID
jgi:lipoyl(octanoyl) transferase